MKTKNIFKSLAMAMLLPAMLLTTACSNDDFTANNDNNVTTAKQGYTLPVTVNVTREGDATMRATYNTTDKKLEFSTGDKLFVLGSHASAGDFAGTLTWTSGTTFTGTITTQNEYTGTADALLAAATSAHAQLLPNGYGSYEYFTYTANSGYDATVSSNLAKAFATTKALAVEQFSDEYAGMYSSGFALSPLNAILNFTISGLTASTEVTATIKEGENVLVSGEVTTDGSGNATFAVGVANGKDLNNLSLTVGGNAITLVSSSKPLEAGHVYNITRSAAPAYTMAANATAGDHGKVVCAAGHLHDAKTAVPTGCTAVGILGKVTATGHGLILALQDATQQSWNTINGWTSVTTYAGTTLKQLPDDAARGANLTSYTTLGSTTVSNWAMAQKSDYEAIFTNLGSATGDPKSFDDNVNAYITTGVAGTAMSGYYWSASLDEDGWGWSFWKPYWNGGNKANPRSLRPVLGF